LPGKLKALISNPPKKTKQLASNSKCRGPEIRPHLGHLKETKRRIVAGVKGVRAEHWKMRSHVWQRLG
jgi:hypothetical protein